MAALLLNLMKNGYNSISDIFRKMQLEERTNYAYKDDVIRNYINLIIHEALKMHTAINTNPA